MHSIADADVLALAIDLQPCMIVTGDVGLLRQARRLGLSVISPTRMVQRLVEVGLLESAKPHLDRMLTAGFGITPAEYGAILQELGER